MSDQAAAARKAFGIRLRDFRRDASLTGVQLARACGFSSSSKVTRIERGQRAPSEDDVRAWCTACGVARFIPELIAALREIDQLWREHRDDLRKGAVHVQSRSLPLYRATDLFRLYESQLVPGFFQTLHYARAVLRIGADLYDLDNDIDAGAQARLVRQELVLAGQKRFAVILEECVLTSVFGDRDVMDEQLDFLRFAATLPNVSLGIIPAGVPRTTWMGEGFAMFDDVLARSSYWTGSLSARRPDELEFFGKLFATLRGMAVYGDAAHAVIADARQRLANS
ncbi:helix-turn-helix transcriptional regulator [Actinocorallia lasiicapitis]